MIFAVYIVNTAATMGVLLTVLAFTPFEQETH